jgi:choline-glycine betaine transporter
MQHKHNQLPTYLLAAAAIAAVLVIAGVPLAALLPFALLLACPLMMIVMMRGMGSMSSGEDHTGHGCEHDPTRNAAPVDQPERHQG